MNLPDAVAQAARSRCWDAQPVPAKGSPAAGAAQEMGF